MEKEFEIFESYLTPKAKKLLAGRGAALIGITGKYYPIGTIRFDTNDVDSYIFTMDIIKGIRKDNDEYEQRLHAYNRFTTSDLYCRDIGDQSLDFEDEGPDPTTTDDSKLIEKRTEALNSLDRILENGLGNAEDLTKNFFRIFTLCEMIGPCNFGDANKPIYKLEYLTGIQKNTPAEKLFWKGIDALKEGAAVVSYIYRASSQKIRKKYTFVDDISTFDYNTFYDKYRKERDLDYFSSLDKLRMDMTKDRNMLSDKAIEYGSNKEAVENLFAKYVKLVKIDQIYSTATFDMYVEGMTEDEKSSK